MVECTVDIITDKILSHEIPIAFIDVRMEASDNIAISLDKLQNNNGYEVFNLDFCKHIYNHNVFMGFPFYRIKKECFRLRYLLADGSKVYIYFIDNNNPELVEE